MRERRTPGMRPRSSPQSLASRCLPPERGRDWLGACVSVPAACSRAPAARASAATAWPAGLFQRPREAVVRECARAGRGCDGVEENRRARSYNGREKRWWATKQTAGGRGKGKAGSG
eukprot:2144005-Pyramimonas_sp.AAC.1